MAAVSTVGPAAGVPTQGRCGHQGAAGNFRDLFVRHNRGSAVRRDQGCSSASYDAQSIAPPTHTLKKRVQNVNNAKEKACLTQPTTESPVCMAGGSRNGRPGSSGCVIYSCSTPHVLKGMCGLKNKCLCRAYRCPWEQSAAWRNTAASLCLPDRAGSSRALRNAGGVSPESRGKHHRPLSPEEFKEGASPDAGDLLFQ